MMVSDTARLETTEYYNLTKGHLKLYSTPICFFTLDLTTMSRLYRGYGADQLHIGCHLQEGQG